ncbi:NACHT domain-containing protein [Mangrovihabitans endophyticus]|uniref:Uncharacterized protein n=1 Tax=Mangrovihabitans endophyticus TaxID=1751298 RepID=A0A8J3FN25_9ACTN|nr:hypothetical protein [Mangrovihabitans endophyticus]GGK89000.1 hypothetical protein GCM10012284_23810 [Mangrovihabitans endophyticus]
MGVNGELERLGPTGFQDLAACLAVAHFGPGVQVMGAGRDGGRDLYHRGQLIWQMTKDLPGEIWDGYTVLQVKHMASPLSEHQENAAWLWGQVRKELEAWSDPDGDRTTVPDFLIVITNVLLTPFPNVGGHDVLQSNIDGYLTKLKDASRDIAGDAAGRRKARLQRLARIRKVRVWDGNQVHALLNLHPRIRDAFPGFLTAGDVFTALRQFSDRIPLHDLETGLREHAKTALAGEGLIYFDEAGSGDVRGIPVHEIVIDLPVTSVSGPHRSSVVKYVLDRAEHVLKPGLTIQDPPRHLIITGAPGNGKTTISKFLVQAFRAAMLHDSDALSQDHRAVIRGTAAALGRFGRELPRNRRWPMRIDLAAYAQEGGLNDDSTLLKWIAHKVSRRSDMGDVTAWTLKTWMTRWPWMLVLDGLDEVTEPEIRKRLIARVTEFVNDAEANHCDMMVVLTTRPIGYTENIAPNHFERIDLDDLELTEAVRYGDLATRVRLGKDLDRIERVRKRLRTAAADEALQHLLRTPLQVLILTIIIDGAGQLAPDRYSLFRTYYDTVFKRERDKPAGLHKILQEHGPQIQLLHEAVGFELQIRSESGHRSYATLTREELRQLTWQVLHDSGFQPAGKDAPLLDQIFDAATKRLVLIAPRGDEGYGFDVRSLQELMAGMHLSSGPLDDVLVRLRAAAASPFWRNTWLFAAGRLFSTPQRHQHEGVTGLIETVDDHTPHRLGDVVPVGPRLALDVIDDGMARSQPRFRDRLLRHGMRVLWEPSPPDLAAITKRLVRYANTGDDQRTAVADRLRDALSAAPTSQATALALQQVVLGIADELRAHTDVRSLRFVKARNTPAPESGGDLRWDNFDDEINTAPVRGSQTVLLQTAAAALRRGRVGETTADDVAAIEQALDAPPVAAVLAAALAHVAAYEPQLIMSLRDDILPTLSRRPIGEQLRKLMPEND